MWNEEARLRRSWGRSSSLFVESENIEQRFAVDVGGIPYDAKFVFSRLGYNLEPSELGSRLRPGAARIVWIPTSVLGSAISRPSAPSSPHTINGSMLPRQMEKATQDGSPSRSSCATRHPSPGAIFRSISSAAMSRRERSSRATSCVSRASPESADGNRRTGYPNADRVMRGGMLLACHHGLSDQQVAYLHDVFRSFASKYQ